MHSIGRAALAVLCGLSLLGCQDRRASESAQPQAGHKGWPLKHEGSGRVYVAEQGFSIAPPTDWKPLGKSPPAFIAYGRPPQDGFTVNMNVNVMPDDGSPIDAAPAQLKSAMPRAFTAWRCVEDAFVDISGRRTYRICSECEVNHVPIRLLQYILKGGNQQVYTLTFTTLPGQFDELKETFYQCADSMLVD
jgi:hypothetical protein